MWILYALALALGAIALSKKETQLAYTGGYSTKAWEVLIIAMAGDRPWQYVMKWMDAESGGNACATGAPGAKGPDGQPREIGLFQLYNPDDFNRLGYKTSEFRTYCIPGTSKQSRALTGDEMRRQVQSGLDLIDSCRKGANRDLNDNGGNWDRHGRDYYALVKMQHGLPGLAHSGLKAVTKKLGHFPRDFDQFRTTLATLPPSELDSGTRAYMHDGGKPPKIVALCGQSPNFVRIFNNAQNTAAVIPERGIV